jgi:hypothetical protein
LALTSPTSSGRSVGIVRSQTKATEFSFSFVNSDLLEQMKYSNFVSNKIVAHRCRRCVGFQVMFILVKAI